MTYLLCGQQTLLSKRVELPIKTILSLSVDAVGRSKGVQLFALLTVLSEQALLDCLNIGQRTIVLKQVLKGVFLSSFESYVPVRLHVGKVFPVTIRTLLIELQELRPPALTNGLTGFPIRGVLNLFVQLRGQLTSRVQLFQVVPCSFPGTCQVAVVPLLING